MTDFSALPSTLPEGVWVLHTQSGAVHVLANIPDEICGTLRVGGPTTATRRGWRMLRSAHALGQPDAPARIGERARIQETGATWHDTATVVRVERLVASTADGEDQVGLDLWLGQAVQPLRDAGWSEIDILLWLNAPCGGLGGRTPRHVAASDPDAVAVEIAHQAAGIW